MEKLEGTGVPNSRLYEKGEIMINFCNDEFHFDPSEDHFS